LQTPFFVTEPYIAANVRKRYEAAIPFKSFANVVALATSQADDLDINESCSDRQVRNSDRPRGRCWPDPLSSAQQKA
jgi:hypothetical protein